MTSTGFTVGLDGTRVSSKVLKPPGGGSSDIFGLGSAPVSANGITNDHTKNHETSKNTQNRLFGVSSEPTSTPARSHGRSNIFENAQVPKSTTKRYVRRNPITGEEVEYFPESHKKAERNGTEETDCSNGQAVDNEQSDEEEVKKTEIPSKPIQTSIRVRNPPGGKSSGIF